MLIKEYQGHRVVTFRDIDTVHERPEGTAKRNFNDNKNHLIEGTDYFIVTTAQKDEIRTLEIPNRGLTLITESGYLMLVKSLTDDLAWQVQRELVNNYFRQKTQKPACLEDIMIKQLEEQKVIKSRLSVVEHKVDEQMTIDYGQQRLIQKAVGRKVYERIEQNYIPEGQTSGATGTPTVRKYFNSLYKDLKNRFGVPSYRDIKRKDYSLALNYINSWIEPQELREETA